MWRYYAIATLVVVAIGSVLLAQRLSLGGFKVHADVKAPPPAAHGNANEGFVTTPQPFFDGQGGWVLSALPGCFTQLSAIEGPSQALVFHIPPARRRFAPGTRIANGNCTVLVRPHDVWVERGKDRLRVPPEARLYDAKDGLTLVYEHGGRTDVRVYVRSGER
ncbi:MAG: hypothetical protein QOJ39_2471 [Candidatus Eremiobacteraeota bacterium]|jgi:hypothetical protein|nr:hypothetical protein [Candidatus Eremiobacteraeota bacterium]